MVVPEVRDGVSDPLPSANMDSSRNQRRNRYDDATRLSLLEDDVDIMRKDIDRMTTRLGQLTFAAYTAALTFATSAVFLALNLVINGL